jgi:hypothetical protein
VNPPDLSRPSPDPAAGLVGAAFGAYGLAASLARLVPALARTRTDAGTAAWLVAAILAATVTMGCLIRIRAGLAGQRHA